MPAGLLIDLDDTLLDDRGAMAAAVLEFREKHDLVRHVADRALAARWDEVGRSLWQKLSPGEVTFEEQRRVRLREVFSLDLPDENADALFADYLRFYERNWSLLPGAMEFLAGTSHLPKVVVTNGRRRQAQQKLELCGVASEFKALVTPDDCGARKPDPKIFVHALNVLGLEASAVMMVGDNFESDIRPALALGMKVFHVNHLEAGRSIRGALSAA
jgi:HAD superfamily hydrolase (TIGR01549 family)